MSTHRTPSLEELLNPKQPKPWAPATWLHWPLLPEQQTPAHRGPGPVLICGGPGTGKTHALLGRALHLARSGIDPSAIIIIAAHAWAAWNMRARLRPAIGGDPSDADLYVGTLQDFCLTRLLRPHPMAFPTLPEGFSVWTRGQSLAALARIAGSGTQRQKDRRRSEDVTPVLEWISENAHCSWEQRAPPLRDEWHDYAAAYQREKSAQNALDGTDVLLAVRDVLLTYNSLRDFRAIMPTRHVLVDNFEAVTALQREVIRAITGPENSVCVAMDPNQSVQRLGLVFPDPHDWFTDRYGADTTEMLRVNHRASRSIMASWRRLMSQPAMTGLTDDDQRELRPENREPESIAVDGRPQGQYRRIADDVSRMVEEGTFDLDQIAILARRRSSLLRINPHLEAVGVPCVAVADFVGNDDPEAEPVLAMLALAVNPKNAAAFRKLGYGASNRPHLGISSRMFRDIQAAAERLDHDLVKAAAQVHADLPPGSTAQVDLARIIDLCQELQGMLATPDHRVTEMLSLVHQRLHQPDADGEPPPQSDEMARLMALARDCDQGASYMALFRADQEGAPEPVNTRSVVQEFLDQTADGFSMSRRSQDQAAPIRRVSRQRPPPGERRVSLATIDMAKGMEWRAVIIADAADHVIPGFDVEGYPAMEEVEQRLFFSAVSRAADWYAVYWPQQREDGSAAEPCRYIRFLFE